MSYQIKTIPAIVSLFPRGGGCEVRIPVTSWADTKRALRDETCAWRIEDAQGYTLNSGPAYDPVAAGEESPDYVL